MDLSFWSRVPSEKLGVALLVWKLYDMIYLTAIGLSPGGSSTYLHTNNT
jgi:hypothetical protein